MIDLSSLNRYIILIKSTTETVLSVLGLIRKEDVMFSIDLKDAYVQIPIHPGLVSLSRDSPRGVFQSQGSVFQPFYSSKCSPGCLLLFWSGLSG